MKADPSGNPFQPARQGAWDGFVARLCSSQADLEIAISVSPSSVAAGATATFAVVVTNRGPDTAAGVVATVAFPSGTSPTSAGTGCTITGRQVTWNIGTLARGESVANQVRARGDVTGTHVIMAQVDSASLDTNAANNDAQTSLRVGAAGTLTEGGSDCFLCCFVATAAYGSPLESHVESLRTFRDRLLRPTQLGDDAVKTYYANSLPWANCIREKAAVKALVRRLLQPVIAATEPTPRP